MDSLEEMLVKLINNLIMKKGAYGTSSIKLNGPFVFEDGYHE